MLVNINFGYFVKMTLVVLFVLLNSGFTQASEVLSVKKVRNELNSKLRKSDRDPTYVILQYSKHKIHKVNFKTQADWLGALHYAESLAATQKGSFYLLFCVETARRLREQGFFKEAYFFLYKANSRSKVTACKSRKTCFHLHEELGLSYYYFRRFAEAGEHLHKARVYAMDNNQRIGVFNTIGLIHREQGIGDSSRFYFEKALNIAKKINHKPWIAVISGNLGQYYWKQGKLELARVLCDRDYRFSLETNQSGSALNALSLLLDIDLKQHKISDARKKLERLEEMIQSSINISEKKVYYEARTAFLEATGEYGGALESYRKVVRFTEIIRQRTDMENIKKTEFQVDFERKQTEISVLHEKKKRGELVIYGLIILTVIIVVVFAILIRIGIKRRHREREIAQLKEQRIGRELEETEREMRTILSNLMEKNTLVEQMTEEINRYQSNAQELTEEKIKLIDKLHSFTLLTDDDWLEFKRLFERINPHFFSRLLKHAPDLTNAEIRLVTLIKLNLSNLEMSRALGISPDSVRKTSLRLRKKLNIELHEELVRFILNL